MIAFPLTRSAFWWQLPVAEATFWLPPTARTARTRGGELLTADYGTRLWQGEVEIADLTADEYRRVAPLLHMLLQAGASWTVDDRSRIGPAADPSGTVIGAATAAIASVVNARELTLQGLPPSYTIAAGDRLSFAAGGRQALHEVVVGRSANASGVTAAIEVTPPLLPDTAAGQAVTLVQPWLRAVIVPDSYQPPRRRAGALYTGGSFSWRQTLRV